MEDDKQQQVPEDQKPRRGRPPGKASGPKKVPLENNAPRLEAPPVVYKPFFPVEYYGVGGAMFCNWLLGLEMKMLKVSITEEKLEQVAVRPEKIPTAALIDLEQKWMPNLSNSKHSVEIRALGGLGYALMPSALAIMELAQAQREANQRGTDGDKAKE